MGTGLSADASAPRADPGRFNHTVHGARGLFALAVFLFHVVNSGLPTWAALREPAVQYLLRTSEFGVELFFCISGYVICGALRRARDPGAFLTDRAVRIYPSLWVSILVIVAIGLATGQHGYGTLDRLSLAWLVPTSMAALPGLLPFGNLNPVGWSLGYEMCFYLFCTGLWAARLRAGPWGAALVVPAAAAMIVFYPRAIFLLCGILVAEGFLDSPRLARLIRFPGVWLLAFLCAWRAIQLCSLPRDFTVVPLFDWADDRRLPLALLAFVAATLGFAGLAAGHGLLGRLLRGRVLQYLGTISFSFYLWHIVVMAGVKMTMLHSGLAARAGGAAQLVFLLVALPLSVLVADLCQRVLERRTGLWLRRRLHHGVPLEFAMPKGTVPG
jgi:peptidoglycan/LPS O-acetylase OafA/YrhL